MKKQKKQKMQHLDDIIRKAIEQECEIAFLNRSYKEIEKTGVFLDYEEFINEALDDYLAYYKQLEDKEEAKYISLYNAFEKVKMSVGDGYF